MGAKAATFSSAKNLSSWVGACPGDDESAGVSRSHRSPKGNRHMRRILNQCANAAVKHIRKHLRDNVSPFGVAPGTQPNHRGDRPWALSADLADSAQGSSIRRTGSGGERKIEEKTHYEDDPGTPTPRLTSGTGNFSTGQSGIGIARDFRPCTTF